MGNQFFMCTKVARSADNFLFVYQTPAIKAVTIFLVYSNHAKHGEFFFVIRLIGKNAQKHESKTKSRSIKSKKQKKRQRGHATPKALIESTNQGNYIEKIRKQKKKKQKQSILDSREARKI